MEIRHHNPDVEALRPQDPLHYSSQRCPLLITVSFVLACFLEPELQGRKNNVTRTMTFQVLHLCFWYHFKLLAWANKSCLHTCVLYLKFCYLYTTSQTFGIITIRLKKSNFVKLLL